MSGLPWLALAAAAAVWALPPSTVVRADGLVGGGRLTQPRVAVAAAWSRPSRGLIVVASAALLSVVTWRAGPALAVATAAVAGVAALLGHDVARARREAARRRAVLTAIRMLAAELSAGVRPADALRAAAATSDDAAAALASVSFEGGGPADGDPASSGLAAAWRLATTSGAALAEVVERVAADVAAREDQRRAVAVAVAGPNSSAALLSGLPLLGVGLGAAMGAQPLDFLLADQIGRVVCCCGVLLDVAGILWMRRIVGRVRT